MANTLSLPDALPICVEAADSSRDRAALRNDNSLEISKLHHYRTD
jgi:hypothetical protein